MPPKRTIRDPAAQTIYLGGPGRLEDPGTAGGWTFVPDPAPNRPEDDQIDWDDAPDQIGDAARPHAGYDADAPSPVGNPAPTMSTVESPATNAEIRRWCLENGVPVSVRGQVQATARSAYDAAHGGT